MIALAPVLGNVYNSVVFWGAVFAQNVFCAVQNERMD